MARDYGRLHTAFWNSPAIRECSDCGKLLAAYLLTGPHSNSIGAYLLPDAYMADDLGWDGRNVASALKELTQAGFCERFADGRHIVICKFLEWNPIENPNVGKAALRQLQQLPQDPALEHVIAGLETCSKRFPNGLETVLEQFRTTKPETKPKPKHEIEHEHEMDLARSASADELPKAIEAYNSLAKEVGWPEAQRETPQRKAKISQRLKECGGLPGWLAAMAKARASPYLRGETKRSKGFEGWTPDLDFFLQQSTFTKLMEGKYDQRGRVQSTGFDALREGASRAAGLDGKRGQGMEGDSDDLHRLALSGGHREAI
jgi:hypothetical protein